MPFPLPSSQQQCRIHDQQRSTTSSSSVRGLAPRPRPAAAAGRPHAAPPAALSRRRGTQQQQQQQQQQPLPSQQQHNHAHAAVGGAAHGGRSTPQQQLGSSRSVALAAATAAPGPPSPGSSSSSNQATGSGTVLPPRLSATAASDASDQQQQPDAEDAAASLTQGHNGSSSWQDEGDAPGPAFRDTLRMLEWQRLCQHLAKHASTALGRRLCERLSVPLQEATSLRLQAETQAMFALESTYTTLLDFGGISSGEAEAALKRAAKGGMVAAKQLRGLVTLLEGADRLKRQVALTARQNRVTGPDSPLRPLTDMTSRLAVPTALMRLIVAAISEDGHVVDSASEQLRTARARVRTLNSRIATMLKGLPGEVSEKGGRVCVAVPAGTRIPNGVLLGTSVGGGMAFIEPGSVVALNNELASARGEAHSAEESVLWDLSGRLMGCLEEAQMAFDVVGWLDLTASKVRFGLWLGGLMPEFVDWQQVFGARPALGTPFGTGSAAGGDSAAAGSQAAASGLPGAADAAVHLRGLSHPLLLADYLENRHKLEQQLRMERIARGTGSSSSGSNGSKKRSSSRLLPSRREVMAQRLPAAEAAKLLAGLTTDESEDDDAAAAGASLEEQLASLRPPRPIDVIIQPQTACVVITGPNTGGKTATMKALGLTACMSKVGLMVPAAAPARLPCFSSVLADIGDEQSLTANLSTFSGHIRRIAAVRSEADPWSLLLLDELGTGTDPTEGAALGQALLKALVRGGPSNGALTVATTHHSTMTGLKFEDRRLENASVEFDEEALAPTYKLLWGVPGRSNALNIAGRLGLDPSIVDAARQRLVSGLASANAAIAELEVAQEQLAQADVAVFAVASEVEATRARAEDLRQLLAGQQQGLALRRAAAAQEVLVAARQLLRALKQERKARLKGNTQSRAARQLDAALGLDTAANAAAKQPAGGQLESAIDTFFALTSSSSTSSSTSSSSSDAAIMNAAAQRQQQREQQERQQQEQWLQQQEAWVQAWARLLARARVTLASPLLAAAAAASGSSGGAAGALLAEQEAAAAAGFAGEDADDDLEQELAALRARAAAAAAKRNAEVAAAQQLVDELWQQQQAAASSAADGGALDSSEGGSPQASQQQQQQQQQRKPKKTAEEKVADELFAAGVRIVEDALETDTALQEALAAQAAATAAAAAAAEQQRRAEAAEHAALLAAMEREMESWELDAAALQQQQQQQEEQEAADAAAASAAQRQQAAAAEQARQQQQATMDLVRQLEEFNFDALLPGPEGQQQPGPEVGASSSSSSKQQQQQQQVSAGRSGSPSAPSSSSSSWLPSAGSAVDGVGGGLDAMLSDLMSGLGEEQQQPADAAGPSSDQQQQQKKRGKKNPGVLKFKQS